MVTLLAVGDLMLGDSEKCIGFGTRGVTKKYGYNYPFDKIRSVLDEDIRFCNLESVISDYNFISGDMHSMQMRAIPEVIKGVSSVFNVVNVANNHIMQHGDEAFHETIRLLKNSKIGIVGLKGSDDYSCKPYIYKHNDVSVGFLGYSFEKERYSRRPLYACAVLENMLKDINRLRIIVDKVVVSCHWGDEFIDRPSEYIVSTAKCLADNGADVILGHHPHVIQPFHYYNESVIFYSLGNFITDMFWEKKLRVGIGASLTVSANSVGVNNIYLFDNICIGQPVLKNKISLSRMSEYLFNDEVLTDDYAAGYNKELNRMRILNRLYMYIFLIWNTILGKLDSQICLQILKYHVFNKERFMIGSE